jgi:FkbM family methyltransferase
MSSTAPSYSPLTSLCLAAYSIIKRSGALDIGICKRAFLEVYFFYKRHLEDPFYNFSRRYPALFRDGIVLDIGANCGYTALVFAGSNAKKVYAFEPDPDNLNAIKAIVTRKSLSQTIVIVPAAVGSEDGSLQLWRNLGHHADHRIATESFKAEHQDTAQTTITVPVVSIDSYLEKNRINDEVTFIKIDVQGFEPPVCQGLIRTLERFPEISVALEYCPVQIDELGFSSSDLLSFFRSKGFTLYLMKRDGSLSTFSNEDLAAIMTARAYADILATRLPLTI